VRWFASDAAILPGRAWNTATPATRNSEEDEENGTPAWQEPVPKEARRHSAASASAAKEKAVAGHDADANG